MREVIVSISDAGFEVMGLRQLIAIVRDAGLRGLTELECHGTGALVQIEVESRLDTDALTALECVDAWEHITAYPESHVYLIEFTVPNLPDTIADHSGSLVGTCDPAVTDHGVDVSLVGPQPVIAETIEQYRAAGLSPELQRLGGYAGRSDPLEKLTDRQREVISLAHQVGYYDVPRQVSIDDIATEIELDPSTVAEHLQRAERNLLTDLL